MSSDTKNQESGQLVRLTQVEYETGADQPDMLGWPVVDVDDNVIGILNDMLVDIETGEIPFGSVCCDDKCKAVPVELIFLDDEKQRLALPVTKVELDSAPDFSDETDDMQPHVDFWNELIDGWQEETTEEIEEEDSIS